MHINSIRIKAVDPQIKEFAEKLEYNPEAILEILVELHESRGVLQRNEIQQIASALEIPAEKVFGIASFYSMLQAPKEAARICDGPACWLKGAGQIDPSNAFLHVNGMDPAERLMQLERSSCLGLCDIAPAALAGETQLGPLEIKEKVVMPAPGAVGVPVYQQPLPNEQRVLLSDIQHIDPNDIDSALEYGAYRAFQNAVSNSPEKVIAELEKSGLKGRGGAGFPVGRKWRLVAEMESDEKFIICNADESEPLTFKDRVLIDANPHKILEGMLLAGYAVGAKTGFIYLRGEYTRQGTRLENAIVQAKEKGLLGDEILGSGFSFNIYLHRGAGAYICGEETALIESLEGKRGEPRIRPPYPASYGYHGKPTVVNNVESFAYISEIIDKGGEWYCNIGLSALPGTKLYTLLGHVNRPGLFETHYGISLRQVIEDFGGGMQSGSEFNFALTGGAAGTIVSSDYLDVPIGSSPGISLGSGAILVCDQSISPVKLLRELMYFFEVESCGKCTPCRIGTRHARLLLDTVISGTQVKGVQEELVNLANLLKTSSFCGLGQFAAMPINSFIQNFQHVL